MTPLSPIGFWSYTSQDDSSSRGRLSQLRRLLADEIQQMVGRAPPVHIFQDVAAIPPGAGWENQIQEAIARASFLIPIITPGFLQSEWCCKEVLRFHERERELGRDDLIFPIYYNDIGDFETFRQSESYDPGVLRLLRERQWVEFRDLRHSNPDSEEVARRFERLANGIRLALYRVVALPQSRADEPNGLSVARERGNSSSLPKPDGLLDESGIAQTGLAASTASRTIIGKQRPAYGAIRTVQLSGDVENEVKFVTEARFSGRAITYILAAVLAVIGMVGFAIYGKIFNDKRARQEEIVLASRDALATAQEKQVQAAVNRESTALGTTPAQIAMKFGHAIVLIQANWRLYDHESGKPIFQKTAWLNGKFAPCYVKLGANNVVPWLTTDDQYGTNTSVGGAFRGTGFVVNEQGFVLTYRRIAAGWAERYQDFSPFSNNPALIFDLQSAELKIAPEGKPFENPNSPAYPSNVQNWRPGKGGALFEVRQPVLIKNSPETFSARNESLTVRFPDSATDIGAELVRISSDADIALIKVTSPQPLVTVELAKDDSLRLGEQVTVLGYESSATDAKVTVSADRGGTTVKALLEPTLTSGVVSRLGSSSGDDQLALMGSPGYGGGPVFDSNGKVVGLFTRESGQETTIFLIPIRYGRDLAVARQLPKN
jgi:serine protease Do